MAQIFAEGAKEFSSLRDGRELPVWAFAPFGGGWYYGATMRTVVYSNLNQRQVWRVIPVLLLATPLAMALRALWLGRPILWVFVLVMGGILMLAFLIWRLIWAFACGRKL